MIPACNVIDSKNIHCLQFSPTTDTGGRIALSVAAQVRLAELSAPTIGQFGLLNGRRNGQSRIQFNPRTLKLAWLAEAGLLNCWLFSVTGRRTGEREGGLFVSSR